MGTFRDTNERSGATHLQPVSDISVLISSPDEQIVTLRQDFIEIMEMLDKRLNDKGKNWRHVWKVRRIASLQIDSPFGR